MSNRNDSGMLMLSVCMYSNTLLTGKGIIGVGAEWGGGGFWNEVVDSEPGTSKDGDLQPCTKCSIPNEGFSRLNNP